MSARRADEIYTERLRMRRVRPGDLDAIHGITTSPDSESTEEAAADAVEAAAEAVEAAAEAVTENAGTDTPKVEVVEVPEQETVTDIIEAEAAADVQRIEAAAEAEAAMAAGMACICTGVGVV